MGRSSMRSGALLVAARLVNVIVQVGSTILLARLLGPYDFGLVTMVLALTIFSPFLVDLGTTDACSQKASITRQEISTLFWLNIGMGTALTLAFAAASGLIASVFGEPALFEIALVSSLTFVLTGLSVQHYALMRRAMEFDRIVTIDVGANVIASVVAIFMALSGWGYWALAVKPLLTLGLTAIGAWISCPWVPGRPRVDDEVKRMVRFGLGVTGFTLTDNAARSADRLALGYFFGAGTLGYFQNAMLLYNNLLSLLTESLHNVAISALSRLREDPVALKRSWASALSMVTFASTAAFAVLAVTGEDLIVLLLGEKWAPAGPLLCILAVRGMAQGVERTMGWLHVVAGRSDRWMRWGFMSAAFQILALAVGLPFGATGVAISYAVAMFVLFVPALAYAGKPLGIGIKDVLAATGPQVVAGCVAAVAGCAAAHLSLADLSSFARLVVSAPICFAVYLVVAVGVFRVTEPLRLALTLLQDLTAHRRKSVG